MATPRENLGILKNGGRTKTWIWLCVGRGVYLGSGGTVGKRKTEKNSARQRNILGELFQWQWIEQLERRWKRLVPVMLVVSYLVLQNKE